MTKIKYNQEKDTYSIKGMSEFELEAIYTLLAHTRLGKGTYESAAFVLLEAFEKFDEPMGSFTPDDCSLGLQFFDNTPTIVLSHYND